MKADRNRAIHHMLVIDGKSLAVAAAAYGISRMRCQQIACAVAKTPTLTKARAEAAKESEPGIGRAPIPKRGHTTGTIQMSYSISAKAATKAAARAVLVAELDKVVAQQPVHERDREAILANVDANLALLSDPPENLDVAIACNGYISWTSGSTAGPGDKTNAVAINCSASFAQRQ